MSMDDDYLYLNTTDRGYRRVYFREALMQYGWYCILCACAVPKRNGRTCPKCGDRNMLRFSEWYTMNTRLGSQGGGVNVEV